MTANSTPDDLHRQVYMVLSPRSLAYATLALETLLSHSVEPLNLHLITDTAEDCLRLSEALEALAPEPRHLWSVTAENQLRDAEADRLGHLPNLRAFRHGHPCWRKVTDPLLLAEPGEELVLLDPDLYFPNRFRFEPTPPTGLLLMWQQPNCLLPPAVVRAAMASGIRLARHVDIGVSHWRAGGDLEWIDWLLGKLGAPNLPRAMHIEAIVWAAIALHEGGGYLDPDVWVCWRRTQLRRLRRRFGAAGPSILAPEPWPTMKCFHAGGEAKWWLAETAQQHQSKQPASILADSRFNPFVELTPTHYEAEQRGKDLLRRFGYYRVFSAGQP